MQNNITDFSFNYRIVYIIYRISGRTVNICLNIMKKFNFVNSMYYIFSGVETVTFK
jgi:hypothetical protein